MAKARSIHGSSGQKVGGAIINAGGSPVAFINLAKGFVQASVGTNFPASLDVNGFPTGTLSSDISNGNAVCDPYYYGRYFIWWGGTGALRLNPQTIIYSGGAAVSGVSPSASGAVFGNFAIGFAGQPTQASPVEFAFGALISAVGTNGGLVQFTSPTAGAFANNATGDTYKFNNVTGLPAGPNDDGSWTINVDDSTHISLQGSGAYAGAVGITGTGGPGVQSEGILSIKGNITWSCLTSGTYSSWSNLTWCKKAHQAAVIAGQLAAPEYVSAFRALNPRFIRFMDFSAVQSDRSTSYAYRPRTTDFSWYLTRFSSDYYVGTMTRGGSDAYTAANPASSPASGSYVEGEVVSAQISGANTTYNATLGLTGRTGTAPIFYTCGAGSSTFYQIGVSLSGSVPPAGTVVTFHFTGGGLAGTYSPTYTTVAGDTTLDAILSHLVAKFRADATLLAANIVVPFNGQSFAVSSQMLFQYNQNIGGLGASLLTVTASDAVAASTYNIGKVVPGLLSDGSYITLTFSTLLGGWVPTLATPDVPAIGPHGGPPLEFYADLANRAGVGVYLSIGQLWSATRISNTVSALALLGVKELAIGWSNETWNSFLAEWPLATIMGCCLGFDNKSTPNDSANSITGLRTAQISALAAAAWTGTGRARSQLFVVNEYQFVDMDSSGSTSSGQIRFKGSTLNPGSNATLAAFGNIGVGTVSINYSAFPNRPAEYSDIAGGAPYYTGGQLNTQFPGTQLITFNAGGVVPLSAYNGLLLAAYNWVNGNAGQKSAALDFLYNGTSGDLYNGTLNGVTEIAYQLSTWASNGYFGIGTFVASFDSARAGIGKAPLGVGSYEGGQASGPISSSDIGIVQASLVSLGDSNGYTSSLPGAASGPSSTVAGDAANIAALLSGFRNDPRSQQLATRYITEYNVASNVGGARTSLSSWYGFTSESTAWALYPGSISSTPWKPWNALAAFSN